VSKIEVRQSSKQCSMGKRLMIIELRTYIEVGKLLIEKESAGLQAHVIYRGEDWRVSITRAAVHMEGKGPVRRTGYRGAYNRSPRRE